MKDRSAGSSERRRLRRATIAHERAQKLAEATMHKRNFVLRVDSPEGPLSIIADEGGEAVPHVDAEEFLKSRKGDMAELSRRLLQIPATDY